MCVALLLLFLLLAFATTLASATTISPAAAADVANNHTSLRQPAAITSSSTTTTTKRPTKRPTHRRRTRFPTKRPTRFPITLYPSASHKEDEDAPTKYPTSYPTAPTRQPTLGDVPTFPPTDFTAPFPHTKFCTKCAHTVRSSRLIVTHNNNGSSIFTPDASQSYKAQWTRDFASLINYAPQLTLQQFPLALIKTAVRLSFVGYRDGHFPDRVDLELKSILSPGGGNGGFVRSCLDNNLFAAIMLASVHRMGWDKEEDRLDSTAMFCELEPQVAEALRLMPYSPSNGLLYNDPASPACTYGFMDTVVLTGNPLFVNVLLFDAASQMAKQAELAKCGSLAQYRALAMTVRRGIDDALYDDQTGYFSTCSSSSTAATGSSECATNKYSDLWGSSYLVYLGLSTQERRLRVLDNLVRDKHLAFYKGHLRHLLQGQYWSTLFAPTDRDTYQNGGYWSTPMGWLGRAFLANGYKDVAREMLQQLNNIVINKNAPEWITKTSANKLGALGYVNSCSNLYEMICGPN